MYLCSNENFTVNHQLEITEEQNTSIIQENDTLKRQNGRFDQSIKLCFSILQNSSVFIQFQITEPKKGKNEIYTQMFLDNLVSFVILHFQFLPAIKKSFYCNNKQQQTKICVTYFMPLVSFYTPLKTSKNQRFSHVFRGHRQRLVA